jgi:glycosyltransferase involved in cell wall biosynthesis
VQRRIAVLVDHFPELSETFVAAEAHALIARGARVRVEAAGRAPHPDAATARGLDVRYAGEESLPERLAALAWLWRRAPRGCLRDLADRRRWRQEEWPRPLRAIAPAARRIEQAGDEHLHAHFGAGAALDALRIGRLLGLSFSVTLHGYDIFRTPRNLPEKLRRAAFATSGSEFTVAHLRALRPGARVHKVVMGVDPERWRRTAPPATTGTVLAVGRLVEKKGFAHLLRAAARLRDAPGFGTVVVVGDGPLRDELHALHAELGLGESVRFLGAQPSDRVRELLEEAAVVAIPCVVAADGDTDSMPVIAKEALAMEVPVVASEVAGLPEVVREPWGRTVPPGDAGALASALRDVLALTPQERAAMGAAGRELVVDACSVDGEAARLLALIDGVIARRQK